MKEELRQKFKSIRKQVSPEVGKRNSEVICENLISVIATMVKARSIAIFLPLPNEVNVLPVMETLPERQYALPQIQRQLLVFGAYDVNTPLVQGKFCLEPPRHVQMVVPDIVVLPLLSFDRQGNRLGYGQGYYDRTLCLPQYKDAKKIGVGYSVQEHPHLPVTSYDIALDMVITEQEIIDIRESIKKAP